MTHLKTTRLLSGRQTPPTTVVTDGLLFGHKSIAIKRHGGEIDSFRILCQFADSQGNSVATPATSLTLIGFLGLRYRIDSLPVGLYVDHGPAATRCLVRGLIELADRHLAIIGKFTLGIGVVDDHCEARAVIECRPLQHLQITI